MPNAADTPTPQEIIAMMAGAPDQLETALAMQPQTQPATPPPNDAPGGEESWTVSEIVGHLCDSARLYGARMRLAVFEERPTLEPFDQDSLVRMTAYRYQAPSELARQFRVVSEANVAFLRGLAPEQWERVGVHAERGPLTTREIAAVQSGHEQAHIAQLTGSSSPA